MITEREVIGGTDRLQEIVEFVNGNELVWDESGWMTRSTLMVSMERYNRDVRYLLKVIKELEVTDGQG